MTLGHPLLGWFGPMGSRVLGELESEAEVEEEESMRIRDTLEVVSASPGTGQLLSPRTTMAFGAAGQGKAAYAFKTDKRYNYRIKGELYLIQDSPNISVAFNDQSSDDDGLALYWGGSAVAQGAESSPQLTGFTFTQPGTCLVDLEVLSAPAAIIKPYWLEGGFRRDGQTGTASLRGRIVFGTMEANAVLALATITSSVAGAIGPNSHLSLYEIDRELS